MRLLPVVLLLTACASKPVRTAYYCDGEETCPPEAFVHPGYKPAGAGLPEYRPTEEEPEVPRSPHKRVLPQTPETRKRAGLWASGGDEPRTLHYAFPALGITIEMDLPDTADFVPAKRCVEKVDEVSTKTDAIRDMLPHLSRRELECYVARAAFACIAKSRDLYIAEHRSALERNMAPPSVVIEGRGIVAADDYLRALAAFRCEGLDQRDLDALIEAWTHAAYAAPRSRKDVQ